MDARRSGDALVVTVDFGGPANRKRLLARAADLREPAIRMRSRRARPSLRAAANPVVFLIRHPLFDGSRTMKKGLGFLAGFGLFALAAAAARTSMTGWQSGRSDVGFWWTVIAGFLLVASLAALVGAAIHARPSD